jgi:hypothetical protein
MVFSWKQKSLVALVVVSLILQCLLANLQQLIHQTTTLFIDDLSEAPLPPCRVLVLNHEYNYHYEVLESTMALYPLPRHNQNCSSDLMNFTFALYDPGRDGIINRRKASIKHNGSTWISYARTVLHNKTYSYFPHQLRRYEQVWRVPRKNYTPPTDFDYYIQATCYCKPAYTKVWLASDQHYCLFHEACPQFRESSQAMWVSPHHGSHYFIPTILPSVSNGTKTQPKTLNLCTTGAPDRRNYHLVANFLQLYSKKYRKVKFYNFGKGKIPPVMLNWSHYLEFVRESDYATYQLRLSQTCHAMLAMLQRTTHPEYFSDKLSGSIAQASAYHLPVLLHADLAKLYEKHLAKPLFVHGDDQESFNEGLEQLVQHLWSRIKLLGELNEVLQSLDLSKLRNS